MFLLLVQVYCLAQVDRAGLNGTIRDTSGKVIPGARVEAIQTATELRRDTISSSSGTYDIPELPIGLYRVACSASASRNLLIDGPGTDRRAHANPRHHARRWRYYAAGECLRRGHATGRNDRHAGRAHRAANRSKELPLNGRNWSTLTALVPGAVDTGGSNQRSIRFAGRGLDDNNFTYDGIDATNIVNQAQQSFVRLAIPTDAIEEFRIDTMLFTAENGSTPGGPD